MSIKKSFLTAKGVYKVTFSLPVSAANGKNNVQLLGDFNNWDGAKGHVMKGSKTEFSTSLELAPGTYEFRYLIDNNIWENDYNADNYVPSPFAGINNSVLFLPAVEKAVTAKKASAPAVKKASSPVVKAEKPAAKETKKVSKPAAQVAKPAAAKTDAVKAPAKAVSVKADAAVKPVVKAKSTSAKTTKAAKK
jgi:hypothetical protein